jgi:cobalamin-dependent methionine synthase I
MEIKIDEKELQKVLNEQTTSSVKASFEGYGMRSAMEKAIADSVIPAIMTEAIVAAASQIDIATLAQKLAEEMARSVTKGVQAIVQDSMVDLIMSIRKVPEYDDKKRSAARAEIIAKVFKNKGETE